ncbi:ArnT family glycosyltransferase [Jiella sonneratiae]|uniref:Glycosyltransferase family 39 protein n=1 Tax=Jiella sonneratiae TaxID=2816856 RepID=A0ABS3IXC1_9HYPH|nr:glycosyltransferase family 39 protein [Jiella sonneratiae]MBO0902061.1 glycosyltransferase family 39 protein [Jiella sonneratiae]
MTSEEATGDRGRWALPAVMAGQLVRAAVLVFVTLAALLPGLAALPALDRDEARFLVASRQMAETGDYVDIRFQEEHRYAKPVGIYWLQNLALVASGAGPEAPIAAYRAVSVAAVLVAVLGLSVVGTLFFGAEAGFVAGLVLASIVAVGFEGHIGKTDATLLAMTVLAQGALGVIHRAQRAGRAPHLAPALTFWLAQAAAILVKGPIAPLASLLTIGTLSFVERDWRWTRGLRPALGLPLLLLAVLPWPIMILERTGLSFFREALGHDLVGKVSAGQESHGAPPGYYVLTFSLFFWPFGAMATGAGLAAIRSWRSSPSLRFCLAWYLPFWLVFEAIATKLPHYVLPAYPGLALLLGWAAGAGDVPRFDALAGWQRWLWRLAACGSGLVSLALAGAVLGAPFYLGVPFPAVAVAIAALVLVAGACGLSTGLRPQLRRVGGAALAAALAFGLFFGWYAPALTPLWPSRSIAALVAADAGCRDDAVAAAGYHEPSLVFALGRKTQLTDLRGALDHLLAAAPCAIAVLLARDVAQAQDRARAAGLTVRDLGAVHGLALGGGGRVDLAVIEARR